MSFICRFAQCEQIATTNQGFADEAIRPLETAGVD